MISRSPIVMIYISCPIFILYYVIGCMIIVGFHPIFICISNVKNCHIQVSLFFSHVAICWIDYKMSLSSSLLLHSMITTYFLFFLYPYHFILMLLTLILSINLLCLSRMGFLLDISSKSSILLLFLYKTSYKWENSINPNLTWDIQAQCFYIQNLIKC
jgi:hypothetical protein